MHELRSARICRDRGWGGLSRSPRRCIPHHANCGTQGASKAQRPRVLGQILLRRDSGRNPHRREFSSCWLSRGRSSSWFRSPPRTHKALYLRARSVFFEGVEGFREFELHAGQGVNLAADTLGHPVVDGTTEPAPQFGPDVRHSAPPSGRQTRSSRHPRPSTRL